MKPSVSGLNHGRCKRSGVDGVFSALEYKSVVKKGVYRLKYEPYIYRLSDIFSRLMYEGFIQNEVWYQIMSASDNMWITCVPLSKKRANKRGYNQSALLGKKLSLRLGKEFRENLLIRKYDTRPQFELKKEQRQKNVSGAFEVNPRWAKKLEKKTIFLVDDVFTSGATLRECGKVLKKAGAERVYALVLAMEQ